MVYIIDDDAAVRKAMKRLLISVGLPVQTFDSGESFLSSCRPISSDCIVADVHMPGMGGLELQETLNRSGVHVPVIFITAFDNEQVRDKAREAGAVGFFSKPCDDQALLDTISFVTKPGRD